MKRTPRTSSLFTSRLSGKRAKLKAHIEADNDTLRSALAPNVAAQRMCRMLVDRAQRFGCERLVRHLDFHDAGHALFQLEPGIEVKAPMPVDFGGSAAATARAHEVAWPEVVRVLCQ